jgi:hypothetical protein
MRNWPTKIHQDIAGQHRWFPLSGEPERQELGMADRLAVGAWRMSPRRMVMLTVRSGWKTASATRSGHIARRGGVSAQPWRAAVARTRAP